MASTTRELSKISKTCQEAAKFGNFLDLGPHSLLLNTPGGGLVSLKLPVPIFCSIILSHRM